jgi:hypothetical protein
MKRQFKHYCEPPGASTTDSEIELSAVEIADAGIREVLQAPGAALGSWKVFDALLAKDTSAFRFLEPLGRSREVKTALSGLFGRFVARAYAEQYLNLQYFAHIVGEDMPIDGLGEASVKRLADGDLPDWVSWRSDKSGLAIVEAKGSHEPGSRLPDSIGKPDRALARARIQAQRATVLVGKSPVPTQHYAIATRWAFADLDQATIAVERIVVDPFAVTQKISARLASTGMTPDVRFGDDEVEEVETAAPSQGRQAGLAVARLHCANLLEPLGHVQLARALRRMSSRKVQDQDPAEDARAILERSAHFTVGEGFGGATRPSRRPTDLIGGYFVRGGPLRAGLELSQADRYRLFDLDLNPVLIGIDRGHLQLLIAGDAERLETRQLFDRLKVRGWDGREPLTGGGGDWVVRSVDIPVEFKDGDPALKTEDPDLY